MGVGWGNKLARCPREDVHLACRQVHDRAIFKSGVCQFWIKSVGPGTGNNATNCRVHRKEKSVIAGRDNLVKTTGKYRAIEMAGITGDAYVRLAGQNPSGNSFGGSPLKNASEFVKETHVVADEKSVL